MRLAVVVLVASLCGCDEGPRAVPGPDGPRRDLHGSDAGAPLGPPDAAPPPPDTATDAPPPPRDLEVTPCPAGAPCSGVAVAITGGGADDVGHTSADGRVTFPGRVGRTTLTAVRPGDGGVQLESWVEVETARVAVAARPTAAVDPVPPGTGAVITGVVSGAQELASARIEIAATRPDALGDALARAQAASDGRYELALDVRSRGPMPLDLWVRELDRATGALRRMGTVRLAALPEPGARLETPLALDAGVRGGLLMVDGAVPSGPFMIEGRFEQQLLGSVVPFVVTLRTSTMRTDIWVPEAMGSLLGLRHRATAIIGARTTPGQPEGGGTFQSIANYPSSQDVFDLDPLDPVEVLEPQVGAAGPLAGRSIGWRRGYPNSHQRVDVRCADLRWTLWIRAGARGLVLPPLPPGLGVPAPSAPTSCTVSVMMIKVDNRTFVDFLAGRADADARVALGIAEAVVDTATPPRPFMVTP